MTTRTLEKKFSADYCKRGSTKCKACKKRIQKGELRIGKSVPFKGENREVCTIQRGESGSLYHSKGRIGKSVPFKGENREVCTIQRGESGSLYHSKGRIGKSVPFKGENREVCTIQSHSHPPILSLKMRIQLIQECPTGSKRHYVHGRHQ